MNCNRGKNPKREKILEYLTESSIESTLLDKVEFKALLRLGDSNRIFLLRLIAHFIAMEALRFNYRELKYDKNKMFEDVQFELTNYPVTVDEFNSCNLARLKGFAITNLQPKQSIGKLFLVVFMVKKITFN